MGPPLLLEALVEVGAVCSKDVFPFEETADKGVDGITNEGEGDGKG
jgi:hypothetical protein